MHLDHSIPSRVTLKTIKKAGKKKIRRMWIEAFIEVVYDVIPAHVCKGLIGTPCI